MKKKKRAQRETLGKADWCLHVWWGLNTHSPYPSKWCPWLYIREGGRILILGGGQKNFPGQGKPKSLFSGEFRPQSNSLGQGWDRMGSFITCPRLLGGAGQKYWGGHGPPGPPSNSLPASGGTNKVFDQEDVILFWLVRRERERSLDISEVICQEGKKAKPWRFVGSSCSPPDKSTVGQHSVDSHHNFSPRFPACKKV